jgi:Xaa-Pro aminopeptidase
MPLANAAVRIDGEHLTLFLDEASPEAALWHGPTPSREDVAAQIGADAAYSIASLPDFVKGCTTLTVQDAVTAAQQLQLREILHPQRDQALAEAIVAVRSVCDAAAIADIRKAAQISVQAHRAGMQATAVGHSEAKVRAVMESVIMANGMTCAYNSIVTVHGEVLHNEA